MPNVTIYNNDYKKKKANGLITEERLKKSKEQQKNTLFIDLANRMDLTGSATGEIKKDSVYSNYYQLENQWKSELTWEDNETITVYHAELFHDSKPVLNKNGSTVIISSDKPLPIGGKIGSKNLLKVDPEAWKSANYQLVSEANNVIDSYDINRVAPLTVPKQLDRTLDDNVTVFAPWKKKKDNLSPEFLAKGLQIYEGFNTGYVMDMLSGKTVDPAKIFYQYNPRGYGKETLHELQEGMQNVVENDNFLVVFDFESSGRADIYGKGIVGPNIVHEFSFTKAQGDFELGDIVDRNAALKNTENSVVGASEEEFQYYMNLIERKFDKREELTAEQEVTIQRLALTGNSKSVLKDQNGKNGLFQFENFAEMDDLKNGITKEDAIKGANRFKNIGIAQGVFDKNEKKMIDFMGQKMYAYEASFLRGIMPAMVADKNNPNTYTLVGHNIRNFDNHLLHAFVNSDKSSAGLKTLWRKLTGGQQASIPKQFDTLAGLTAVFPDRVKAINDMFSHVYKDPNKKEVAYKQWQEFINRTGKGVFTQESLMHIFFSKDGQKAAHVASEDALGNARLFFALKDFLTENMQNRAEIPHRTLSTGQAYYAVNAPGVTGNNLTAVAFDNMTGQLRTSDGFAVTDKGVEVEAFGQRGIRKHGLYEIVKVGNLGADNPLLNKFKQMNPDLNLGGSSFIWMRPITRDAKANDIVYFGDTERLQNFMNGSMRFAGEYHDGEIDKSFLSQAERGALNFITKTNTGVSIQDYNDVDIIGKSDFAFKNEPAARVQRSHSIKKDAAMIDFIHDMDAYVFKEKTRLEESYGANVLDLSSLREDYRVEARQRTREIYAKMAKGENVDDLMTKPNYIKYFGYEQFNKDSMRGTSDIYAYSETIYAADNREAFVRKHHDVITSAINASLKSVDETSVKNAKNKDALQMHYDLVMTAMEDAAIKNAEEKGLDQRSVMAYETQGLAYDELKNKYEIDLDGFRGIKKDATNPEGSILRLKLSASGYNVAEQLVEKVTGRNADKVSLGAKAKIVRDFQEFVAGKIPKEERDKILPDEYKITRDDSYELASLKLSNQLTNWKENHATDGLIKPTERMNVLDVENGLDNYGLSPEQIDEVVSKKYAKFKVVSFKDGKGNEDAIVDEVAQLINDKILTPDAPDLDKTIENGFTEKDARQLIEEYKKRKKAGLAVAKELVSGIFYSGGTLAFDHATNSLFLKESGKSEEFSQLFLPSQRYENGNMYIEIGKNKNRKLDPTGVYGIETGPRSNRERKMIFGSLMDVIKSKLSKFTVSKYIDRAVKNGDTMANEVNYIINSVINSPYKENPVELTRNMSDARLGSFISIKELTENIDLLEDTKAIKNYKYDDFSYIKDEAERANKIAKRDAFFKLVFNKPKNFDDYGSDEAKIIGENFHILQSALKEYFDNDPNISETIDSLNVQIKQWGKGYVGRGISQVTGIMKRGIEDVKLNAPIFDDLARIQKMGVLEDYPSQRNITFGQILKNRFATQQLRVNGKQEYNALNVTGLTINSFDLNRIVQEGLARGNQYSKRAMANLSTLNTTDAAGILSPYSADLALHVRTYEQKVAVRKLADNADQIAGGMLSKRVMAKISIDKDGNIVFSYKNGEFVFADNSLAGQNKHKIMLEGGLSEDAVPLKIKESGFLQHRFYNRNSIVSEEYINEFLNQDEIKKKISEGKDKDEQIRIAHELLASKFDSNLRIKSATDPLAVKIVTEFEKNEASVVAVGFGAEDARIAKFTEELAKRTGANKENRKKVVDSLIGQVFNIEVLDSIDKNDDDTLFLKMVNAVSGKKRDLTHKDMEKAARKAGFESLSQLKTAVFKERSSDWDILEDILGQAGILTAKDLNGNIIDGKVQHIDAIVNNVAGQIKHLDLPQLNQVISEMQYTYMQEGKFNTKEQIQSANNEIVNLIRDRGIHTGLEVDSDTGEIIKTQDSDFNLKALLDLKDELGIEKRAAREGAFVQRMTIMQAPNYDITKYGNISYNERVITNLDMSRLDAESEERIHKTLSNYKGVINDKAYENIKEILSGNIYDGQTRYREHIANINAKQSYTAGEDLVYSNYEGEELNYKTTEDIKAALMTSSKEEGQGIKKLYKKGMSIGDIYDTISAMRANGAERITWDRALNMFSLTSALVTNNFNNHNGRVTLESLQNRGYKVIDIQDMDVDVMSRGKDNSLMDNKIIVDLGERGSLKGNKSLYLDDADRYIALPFSPTARTDEAGNEIRSNIQAGVSRIYRQIEKYNDEYAEITEEERDRQLGNIKKSISSLRTSINEYATSNNGVVKTAYRAETEGVSKKAHAVKIYGTETVGFHSRLNYEGVNLSEFARATETNIIYQMGEAISSGKSFGETMKILDETKASIPFVVLGKDDFAKSYSGIIKDIEKQDARTARQLSDALFKYFKSGNGTTAMARRYPTNYQSSESAVALFFDIFNNKGNSAYIEEDFWNAVHGDSDSDSVYTMLAKTRAKIRIGNVSDGLEPKTFEMDLDAASIKLLNKIDGITITEADNGKFLEEAKRNVFNTGFTVSSKYLGEAEGVDWEKAYENFPETLKQIKQELSIAEDQPITREMIENLSDEQRGRLRAHFNVAKGGGAIFAGKAITERSYDGAGTIAAQRLYSNEEINKYEALFSQLKSGTRESLGAEAFNALSGAEQRTAMMKYAGDDADMIEALKFDKRMEEIRNSVGAFSGKKSAGLLDNEMYSIFRTMEQSGEFSASELKAFQMIRTAAQEGTTLTAKSETSGNIYDNIHRIQSASRTLMSYITHPKKEGWEQASQEVRDIFSDVLGQRAGKELAHLDDEFVTYEGGERHANMDHIMDLLLGSVDRIRANPTLLDAQKTFSSRSGSSTDKMPVVSNYEQSSLGHTADIVNTLSEQQGYGPSIKRVDPPRAKNVENPEEVNLLDVLSNATPIENITLNNGGTSGASNKAYERLMDHSKQLQRRGGLGAIGAGIAAGIMGLGFLAGNHSPAPANTMAQDASAYESQQVQNGDMYNAAQLPTLSDSNLNVRRGGANQGYVININAQTTGGQQAAQQAIAGAVSTLTPQNGSVNISMNTSVADKINQLQLHRMVSQSMGMQFGF